MFMIFSDNNLVSRNEISQLFPHYPWLSLGISERRHGNLRLGPKGEIIDVLSRARFSLELGVPPERVIAPILVHGATARIVSEKDLEGVFEADGLITSEPDLFLSVTTADCLPIYFVDSKTKTIGLAHAGWRGILRGLPQQMVAALEKAGASTDDISAAIGPSIHSCHFEVDLNLARQFEKHLGNDVAGKRNGKFFVDLQKSATRLLNRAGILPANIAVSPVCTYCEERFFSHRRDGQNGLGIEAMMAVIGVNE